MSRPMCEGCDREMPMEHRHSMNHHLVTGLLTLSAHGGNARISELPLDRNELDNFQKLQYFNLVERVKRGVYRITDAGRAFLAGTTTVPEWVTTYNNKVTGSAPTEVPLSVVAAWANEWGFNPEAAV